MGDSILSKVKKAAKLAVYDDIIIKVKNHHIPPTILVERAFGISSDPIVTPSKHMRYKQWKGTSGPWKGMIQYC